ncbi:helix-turn-helix domain-containing protein [Lewinella sp. JB7]|uniref:winged helix-turn-helix transcriptional regulator n=1 Tax=Lewinella sp. JB7 TaxID=2962887 RepID=UPI0020C9AAAF|nr:helix-turn-helix domain-containing protein [Lewinella sp. JB7]MCP9237112.1 helix-turn-helix transcriptional regulator [Lewinella sp. JB7]
MNDMLPVRDALFVVGGKWKLMILISLSHGNTRFTQIEKSIPKISSKVLSKELKDLEENELIKRTVVEDYPVSIRYSLTDYAQTLGKVILELHTWGINHRKRIIGKNAVTADHV